MSKIKLLKNISSRRDMRTGNWRGEGKPHGAGPCPTTANTTLLSSDREPVATVTLGIFPTQGHLETSQIRLSTATNPRCKALGGREAAARALVGIHPQLCHPLLSPQGELAASALLHKLLHSSFPSKPEPLSPRPGFPYSSVPPSKQQLTASQRSKGHRAETTTLVSTRGVGWNKVSSVSWSPVDVSH